MNDVAEGSWVNIRVATLIEVEQHVAVAAGGQNLLDVRIEVLELLLGIPDVYRQIVGQAFA